jgi:hypothetical protein
MSQMLYPGIGEVKTAYLLDTTGPLTWFWPRPILPEARPSATGRVSTCWPSQGWNPVFRA